MTDTNVQELLEEFGDKNVTDLHWFFINAALRKVGIRLNKELLQEMATVHTSLTKPTTVVEFLTQFPELSAKVGEYVFNSEDSQIAEDSSERTHFECQKCGYITMDGTVVRCPQCG